MKKSGQKEGCTVQANRSKKTGEELISIRVAVSKDEPELLITQPHQQGNQP
jgi:hypothetical protein